MVASEKADGHRLQFTNLIESGSFRSYSRSVRSFRPGSFRPDFRGESFRPNWGGSFRPSFKDGSFRPDLRGESFRPDIFISGKQLRYLVIRAFSDFKAFLYFLIGGFSVRGCYHIKTPNFPLPRGRGTTSLPS